MRPTLILLIGALLIRGTPAGAAADITERWFYKPDNLLVDANADRVVALIQRAARAGYTHMLISDSKFSRLGEMPPTYFRNVERVKSAARESGIEVVPALFPIGYSNDLLSQDPNLIEALPVTNALFVVRDGVARAQSELPRPLRGGDFSDLKAWDWHDPTMVSDQGAVRAKDPAGANARITQRIALIPHRQYHLSVRVRTEGFTTPPEAKVLSGNQALNFDHLGVRATQDWRTHHVVFNSLSHTGAVLYLGAWGAGSGSL
jgi:hypothetical protein